jgi:myo-inositol-1(or 4)-monophosphatase
LNAARSTPKPTENVKEQPMPDWQHLTDFALAMADAAAAEILPHFRADAPVDIKPGVVFDPVTEGDRAGERVMRRMIEERFPDHGIHGEEYGIKEAKSDFTWILDPVDGTRGFICGMPTWGTLIGLNVRGKPMLGLMNQPWVGEVFYGNPHGAWVNHRGERRTLRTRAARPLAQCTVATTAPEPYRSERAKAVLREMSAAARLTRYGGDAYFFCLMAAGQIDIAMDAGVQPYDIAPLMPIIAGAGGEICTWTRGDAAQGGDVVSAGSREMLETALEVIARAG